MSTAATALRELHREGCFVLPNPWNVGTAVFLEQMGFRALATTSSGFAFDQGLPDRVDALSRDDVLRHAETLVEAVSVPVSVDFQSGYAAAPEGVGENARRCAGTGAAGLSIEDATGNAERPLFDLPEAVERLRAARAGIDAVNPGIVLTGRAEGLLLGVENLDDVLRRLAAYAEAGTDCLFAPGLDSEEQIRAVVEAVAPKPVNVLISKPLGLSVSDLAEMGVRRVSVGSALARAAWGALSRAAREIAEDGRFDALGEAAPFAELNDLFEGRCERH